MARRRKRSAITGKLTEPAPRLDADWTRTPEFRANGRILTPGVEFSIRGERGRFRFIEHVITSKGAEWLSCVGGKTGVAQARAFRPDRVRRVHRTKTILSNRDAIALIQAKRAAREAAA